MLIEIREMQQGRAYLIPIEHVETDSQRLSSQNSRLKVSHYREMLLKICVRRRRIQPIKSCTCAGRPIRWRRETDWLDMIMLSHPAPCENSAPKPPLRHTLLDTLLVTNHSPPAELIATLDLVGRVPQFVYLLLVSLPDFLFSSTMAQITFQSTNQPFTPSCSPEPCTDSITY